MYNFGTAEVFYWPQGKPDLTEQQPTALVKLSQRSTRKPVSPQWSFKRFSQLDMCAPLSPLKKRGHGGSQAKRKLDIEGIKSNFIQHSHFKSGKFSIGAEKSGFSPPLLTAAVKASQCFTWTRILWFSPLAACRAPAIIWRCTSLVLLQMWRGIFKKWPLHKSIQSLVVPAA